MRASRVLASQRRQRFFFYVRQTYGLAEDELVRVIRASEQYTPALRVAALRNLVAIAPISVTQGRCYAQRRSLVRAHYAI